MNIATGIFLLIFVGVILMSLVILTTAYWRCNE